ncbi:MAG: hypothetical protein ACJASX_002606 [Limisphaerales bacterium]|jgi:hypothetical protein
MNVSQYINSTNGGYLLLQSSNMAAVVVGFGREGVPYFIEEFWNASSQIGGNTNWLSAQLVKLGKVSLSPIIRRRNALLSLTILGRQHPEEVDPFFTDLLSTTNRHESIQLLGHMGDRHFNFLTNLIAAPNRDDAQAAIWGLVGMGTNAQAAVPLVFSSITNHPNRRRMGWYPLFALQHIGEHHVATLPTLIGLLGSTDRDARFMITRLLAQMTNHHDQIAPVFARLGQKPITATNDPGEFVSYYLSRVGVPPDVAVPILIRRLKHAITQDGSVPDPNSQTSGSLSILSPYGFDARDAIPLIENEVLPHLPVITDRSNPIWLTRYTIENSLRKIDPAWKRPVAPK